MNAKETIKTVTGDIFSIDLKRPIPTDSGKFYVSEKNRVINGIEDTMGRYETYKDAFNAAAFFHLETGKEYEVFTLEFEQIL